MKAIDERFREHQCGWEVLLDNKVVCRLRYCGSDPPFYDFMIEDVACPKETVAYIFDMANRPPTPNIIYRNRGTRRIAQDEDFMGALHGDKARFRDYRPIPHSKLFVWGIKFLSWFNNLGTNNR